MLDKLCINNESIARIGHLSPETLKVYIISALSSDERCFLGLTVFRSIARDTDALKELDEIGLVSIDTENAIVELFGVHWVDGHCF